MTVRLAAPAPASEVVSTAGAGDFRDPPAAGVLAVTSARRAVLGQRWLGPAGPARSVWWTACVLDEQATWGLEFAARPDVETVTVTGPGDLPVRVRLAVAFALHMTDRPHLGPRYVPVTSPSPVPVPTGVVCVARLVTLWHRGRAMDTALWETSTPVREYLRHGHTAADIPVRAWVDAHAHQLAGLRTTIRTGRLPRTAAARTLTTLLDGQPLTVSFAQAHVDLLADVLRSTELRTR
ncbi:hypothetical protein R8Z50_22325 [Longispora sp. K20-0274]|uniref:hypothetical protein n=1 Tax=Longispora sp. K20-0274 TaxID=3088255 RepID=UPI00399C2C96